MVGPRLKPEQIARIVEIADLTAAGLLRKTARARANGGTTSCRYMLALTPDQQAALGKASGKVMVVPLTLANSASITRPMVQAREVAMAIAEGDLTQPINSDQDDEVGDLLRSLADMQSRLRVLETVQRLPNFSVVAHPRLGAAQRAQLRQCLLSLAAHPERGAAFARASGVTGIVDVDTATLRELDAYVEATRRAMAGTT